MDVNNNACNLHFHLWTLHTGTQKIAKAYTGRIVNNEMNGSAIVQSQQRRFMKNIETCSVSGVKEKEVRKR